MLTIEDRPVRLCDGLSRREWLRVGGLGALGLSLHDLLAARAAAKPAHVASSFGRAKSCIILFLMGGPPQHETWDPKPEAPLEIRGNLKPISSRVPGLAVGELMPRVAALTDKICVLRAVATNDNAHSSSGYWMLTGTPHSPTNSENATPGPPNDRPCLGAVVKHLSDPRRDLPAAITLPEEIWNTGRIVWPGQDGGYLGRAADPWLLTCDPNAEDFKVPGLQLPQGLPPLRFSGRQRLLAELQGHLDLVERAADVGSWDATARQAFDLLGSQRSRRAFDLNEEPDAARDRYGRSRFGQSVLLSRRLVEAGVPLVQVNWTRTPEDQDVNPVWDTHTENEKRLQTALMPPMDLAYSTLLEDLEERGLLDETLVVWMGEFGRTPRINKAGGRDHWGYVFSVALSGGGVRGGHVHGSSDATGGLPRSGRVEPQELTATILHCLGIEPETLIHDRLNRPFEISPGEVLHEILG